jgi:hypothetical protein
MAYTVQSLPMPKRAVLSTREAKYPFASLTEVGQCFVEFNVDPADVQKTIARLTSAMTNYRKTVGDNAPRFAVRQDKDEDGNIYVGVWRVAAKQPKVAAE